MRRLGNGKKCTGRPEAGIFEGVSTWRDIPAPHSLPAVTLGPLSELFMQTLRILCRDRHCCSPLNWVLTSPLWALALGVCLSGSASAELRVGAARVDVTPNQMPVLVNGGMLTRSSGEIKTRVNARAIVIDDGDDRMALVVVDSCMMPKMLLDDAKHRAANRTKLRADRIMISATHTHTAPSAFGALGTDADPTYVPFLREKLVEAIVEAESKLQPAKVGFVSGAADDFTALRRWVRRPDKVDMDPFGNLTVRANMHAARNPDDVTGPSGPEDPELSMIAFRSIDGRPIALLANFSMHYFGDKAISADYFGLFCDGLEQHAAASSGTADVVAIMSHGCSGDIWRRDYMTWQGKDDSTIEGYAQGLLQVATDLYDSVEYGDADIAFAEKRLAMKYRVPDAQRLLWAKGVVEPLVQSPPKTREQVYAREQILLHELQETEVVVQAMRIGDIAIATTPNETYALTGLKLKLQSPLAKTMVIELANGADGYIPPPEQHALGGYNTWAARSAGLEVEAEPRIVAAGLELLESVTGKQRRRVDPGQGPKSKAIAKLSPAAYWRLHEQEAPLASDASGNHRHGSFERRVLYFLEGPAGFAGDKTNRCVHFAGDRMRVAFDGLGTNYSIIMSIWNGMPNDVRETSGWFFSRDHAHGTSTVGDHFGLGGKGDSEGRLVFKHGNQKPVFGKTVVDRWKWYQVVLVRSDDRVSVFLEGNGTPEIETSAGVIGNLAETAFIGGRSDDDSNWEGRIDEVALFDRALTAEEVAAVFSEESQVRRADR